MLATLPLPFYFLIGGLVSIFLPKGRSLREYSMQIFDSWGNLLFETDQLLKSLDETNLFGFFLFAKAGYFEVLIFLLI